MNLNDELKPFESGDLRELEKLEEALWKTETRFDLEFQEKYFAPDFFEFGRSGRKYSRDQMIRTEPSEIRAKLPLKNFYIHVIDRCTVLTTYISEVQYDNLEKGNRSSLWSMCSDGWKLRFHQGTPVSG